VKTIAKKRFWLGILVMVLVFGMTVVGCDDGSTNGGGEKTLIIQNMPANVFTYAQSGGLIGVFPVGTTPQQALLMSGLVAGADLSNPDIIVAGSDPYTITIPLYNINNNNRWTGSGTFAIYAQLGTRYYRASSVNITYGTTTIPFSRATEVTLDGDGTIYNDPTGIWDFSISGQAATVTITGNNWVFNGPTEYYDDTGTFTQNGNIATLYSNTWKTTIGTATLTSNTTITLTLVSPSVIQGTFSGTKR
jgi:hypothetical protein